jgi:hypothetical protein
MLYFDHPLAQHFTPEEKNLISNLILNYMDTLKNTNLQITVKIIPILIVLF